jgi:hypothetical protein
MENKMYATTGGQQIAPQPMEGIGNHLNNQYGNNYQQPPQQQHYVMPNTGQVPMSGEYQCPFCYVTLS